MAWRLIYLGIVSMVRGVSRWCSGRYGPKNNSVYLKVHIDDQSIPRARMIPHIIALASCHICTSRYTIDRW
jgi:hypothetical protein